ncbi:MAG: helix-turn-helix domain-containing protein [Lachnospiraceae bacterium]|nr:helix-turn-helix transcriptional regulator [Lachnospiraceae bacterium]MCI8826559.1 helix-turn-helix transcriptional regulator [Lachnospiraceae bacterium]
MELLLQSIRNSRNISLRELSSQTGLEKAAISNFETGKSSPTLKQLESIAKALDCKISDLYESEYK